MSASMSQKEVIQFPPNEIYDPQIDEEVQEVNQKHHFKTAGRVGRFTTISNDKLLVDEYVPPPVTHTVKQSKVEKL